MLSSNVGSGDGGLDDIEEGWRCGGRRLIRWATLISSVCTEIDLDGTGTCMETWQPASLKCWGSNGSCGVAGAELGGCNWIDGMGMGGGGGARLGDCGSGASV